MNNQENIKIGDTIYVLGMSSAMGHGWSDKVEKIENEIVFTKKGIAFCIDNLTKDKSKSY